MNFNEYQELSKRTMPATPDQERHRMALANYSMGLSGESGELIDMLKKHLFHGHELDREAILKEIGDILHYAAGITTLLGLQFDDAAVGNIEKLKKRYKDGFSEEASKARVDVNG